MKRTFLQQADNQAAKPAGPFSRQKMFHGYTLLVRLPGQFCYSFEKILSKAYLCVVNVLFNRLNFRGAFR